MICSAVGALVLIPASALVQCPDGVARSRNFGCGLPCCSSVIELDTEPYECRPCPPPPSVTPPDPSVKTYTIKDPDFPRPLSFKIQVPESLTIETWDTTLKSNLEATLPSMLKQLSVDASQISALATEGIPLISEAVLALQTGVSLPDDSSDLARRGIFSKIGKWVKK